MNTELIEKVDAQWPGWQALRNPLGTYAVFVKIGGKATVIAEGSSLDEALQAALDVRPS